MNPLDVDLTTVVAESMVRVGAALAAILAIGGVADRLLHGGGLDFLVAFLTISFLTGLAWALREHRSE